MQLTLSKDLERALRAEVAQIGFRFKDRKLRLMLMRSLVTYPEYEYRLSNVRTIVKAKQKADCLTPRQASALFDELNYMERRSILRDMKSAFEILDAVLKCKYKINHNLPELRKHVFRQIF
jgi:hypothetical protein